MGRRTRGGGGILGTGRKSGSRLRADGSRRGQSLTWSRSVLGKEFGLCPKGQQGLSMPGLGLGS